MPRQRAIRFPDDLHDAIEAEARRLGHPHTFSSVIVNAARVAIEQAARSERKPLAGFAVVANRGGSPSPSLERFANPESKR